jgi:hypothetical protein
MLHLRFFPYGIIENIHQLDASLSHALFSSDYVQGLQQITTCAETMCADTA